MTLTQRRARVFAGAALAVIVLTGFAWSVHLRQPWFGALSWQQHQWHTGQTLMATRNWWADGAWRLRWLWLDEPPSVEFPTLESRHIYPSYPSGAAIPVYLLACLRGSEPDLALIMGWNRASHAMIALAVTTACYLMLLRLGWRPRDAMIMCLPPAALLLYSPAPMYWLQNTYFADEAVILPFALLLLLEVVRDTAHGSTSRVANRLMGIVALWGIFTDWLFYCVVFVLIVKRLLQRHRPAALLPVVCGTVTGIALFCLQLGSVGMLGVLKNKFLYRTGMSETALFQTGSFYASFWHGHVARGFGVEAVWLLWAALAAAIITVWFARRRKTHLAAWWAMLVIVPCFMQPYLLQHHSRIHSFSALKMMLPLAAVVYVILPALVLSRLLNAAGLSRRGRLTVWLLPWLIGCAMLLVEPMRQGTVLFPKPDRQLAELGLFVAAHTDRSDLVFSDDAVIDTFPPQAISLSMKHVYPTAAMDEVIAQVPAGATYHVKILKRDDGRWVMEPGSSQ